MQSAACAARVPTKKTGVASAFLADRLRAFYLSRWQGGVWLLVLALLLMSMLALKLAESHP